MEFVLIMNLCPGKVQVRMIRVCLPNTTLEGLKPGHCTSWRERHDRILLSDIRPVIKIEYQRVQDSKEYRISTQAA